MKYKKQVFALSISAAMVALSVVLCRFAGFSAEGTPFRFELGFLPIALTAHILGPLWAAIAYLTADVIGSLFSGYAPNIWISLCQMLFGFTLGAFLHGKKQSFARISVCFVLIGIFIDVLLKSPIFVFMYDWTWEFTLVSRAINAAANTAIRILSYYLIARALEKPLHKYLTNKN